VVFPALAVRHPGLQVLLAPVRLDQRKTAKRSPQGRHHPRLVAWLKLSLVNEIQNMLNEPPAPIEELPPVTEIGLVQ